MSELITSDEKKIIELQDQVAYLKEENKRWLLTDIDNDEKINILWCMSKIEECYEKKIFNFDERVELLTRVFTSTNNLLLEEKISLYDFGIELGLGEEFTELLQELKEDIDEEIEPLQDMISEWRQPKV